MFKEFKEFITKGNVIDMAVGLVTGSAFTAIVTSLVNDVIMPPIGLLVSGLNFSDIKIILREAVPATETAAEVPEVAILIGSFIQAIINFLIVALVIFLVVKGINKMRSANENLAKSAAAKLLKKGKAEAEDTAEAAEEAEAEPEIPADIALLAEIRDLLKETK